MNINILDQVSEQYLNMLLPLIEDGEGDKIELITLQDIMIYFQESVIDDWREIEIPEYLSMNGTCSYNSGCARQWI